MADGHSAMLCSTLLLLLLSILFPHNVNGWLPFFGKPSWIAARRQTNIVIPDEVLTSRNTTALYTLMNALIDSSGPEPVVVRSRDDLCGAWEVVCTRPGPRGEPQWVKYSKFLSSASGGPRQEATVNRNFQLFSPDGTFVNLSEYASTSFYATASGTFTLNLPEGTVPQVTATVDNVRVHFGLPAAALSLGVSGTGFVCVRFLDARNGLRVFENEDGAQVLQRRLAAVPTEYASFLR